MLNQEVNIYFLAFMFALMTKGIKLRFHQDLVYLEDRKNVSIPISDLSYGANFLTLLA